jgi:phosphatidate cytidylyltransferase
MLVKRVRSGLILGFLTLGAVFAGVPWLALVVLIGFGIGIIEFAHLVARQGHRASSGLMLLWLVLFIADRLVPEVGLAAPGTAALLLLTMTWAVVRYRQGTANAVTGFALTLAGGFYIGWSGAHFVGLRAAEDGLYWTLTVLVAVVSTDTAAYLVGSAIGRRRLIPDISPGKTWEGYLAGVVASMLITSVTTYLWRRLGASETVSPLHGLVIGALISVVGPVGDFGISVLKRYADAKHASNLIPGHGGFLDRVDVLIVAGLLGYYYVDLFVL